MDNRTIITRLGTIHYLECFECGEPKKTRHQRKSAICKSCSGKQNKLADTDAVMKSCKVCEKVYENTQENFHWKDKKKGRLDRTCKQCDCSRRKQWALDNPEREGKMRQESYNKYREQISESRKIKRQTDPSVREYHRNYYRENLADEPTFKCKRAVSRRVHESITAGKRAASTFDHLPYTPEELKEHLERQFDERMNWENYGTYWHIDHIYPQSLLPYDTLEHPNFQKCWALENLRPLEAIENIRKSNKILSEE